MLTASSASGQEIEVSNEATGVHCGTVVFTPPHTTSGGCAVNVSNTSAHISLLRHTGTGEVAGIDCDNTYRLNIGENGEGYANQFRNTNGGTESPACGFTVTACDVEGNGNHEPWPIHIEETGANTVHAVVRMCLDILVFTGPPAWTCEVEGNIELALVRKPNGHVAAAEIIGDGQGVPITNRVVVAHGAPHATCEGIGAQAELAGHWAFSPSLLVIHL